MNGVFAATLMQMQLLAFRPHVVVSENHPLADYGEESMT